MKYETLMTSLSPIPVRVGAGELTQSLAYGPGYDCVVSERYADQKCVARSYGYTVMDISVAWTMPHGHTLTNIGGLLTGTGRNKLEISRREPAPCHWAVKSRGYSGAWISGYLYRGHHSTSLRGLVKRVDAARRASATTQWLHRHDDANLRIAASHIWVTVDRLIEVGACRPGINAARERVECALGASGELGGVRADALLALGDVEAIWAKRVVMRAMAQNA